MAYYSEGAFDWNTIYEMPVYLKRYYYNKLAEVKKKEKEEQDKTMAKAKRGGKK